MSVQGRLDALESSLAPQEAVLRWLAEARSAGGVASYAGGTVARPDDPTPAEQLLKRVALAARGTSGTRRQRDAAVRSSLEQAALLYELVVVLNAAAGQMVERLDERHTALAAALPDQRETSPDAALLPAAWREQVDRLASDAAVEIEARESLVRRHIGRCDPLFPDLALDWRQLIDDINRLVGLIASSTPKSRGRSRRATPATTLAQRVARRAAELEAQAQLGAARLLGDQERVAGLLAAGLESPWADGMSVWWQAALERRSSVPGRQRWVGVPSEKLQPVSYSHPLDRLPAADRARQLRALAAEAERQP